MLIPIGSRLWIDTRLFTSRVNDRTENDAIEGSLERARACRRSSQQGLPSWGMVRDSKANPKMQADSNGRESGKYPAESYNQRLRHGTLTAVFHCDYCRHVYPLACDSLALYGTRNNVLNRL